MYKNYINNFANFKKERNKINPPSISSTELLWIYFPYYQPLFKRCLSKGMHAPWPDILEKVTRFCCPSTIPPFPIEFRGQWLRSEQSLVQVGKILSSSQQVVFIRSLKNIY